MIKGDKMDNVVKKVILLGLGIGATTKDKIEKLIKELVKKGELSAKEGNKIKEDFVKKSKKQTDDVRKIIDLELKMAVKKKRFATKADLKVLERKIDKLNKQVNAPKTKGQKKEK